MHLKGTIHRRQKATTTTNRSKEKETNKRMPSPGTDLLTWTNNQNSKKAVQGSY
jgi:hypothetical protein